MANEGRSIGGRKDGGYYPQSRQKEAAKYVRLIASRFVKDEANVADLREACTELLAALDNPQK